MQQLLSQIVVPKVLLWFSSRAPELEYNKESYVKYVGDFPQLVDRRMVDAVAPLGDAYVEVVSQDGLPVEFKNRYVGGGIVILAQNSA